MAVDTKYLALLSTATHDANEEAHGSTCFPGSYSYGIDGGKTREKKWCCRDVSVVAYFVFFWHKQLASYQACVCVCVCVRVCVCFPICSYKDRLMVDM